MAARGHHWACFCYPKSIAHSIDRTFASHVYIQPVASERVCRLQDLSYHLSPDPEGLASPMHAGHCLPHHAVCSTMYSQPAAMLDSEFPLHMISCNAVCANRRGLSMNH